MQTLGVHGRKGYIHTMSIAHLDVDKPDRLGAKQGFVESSQEDDSLIIGINFGTDRRSNVDPRNLQT